jgi:hypothetical protein
MDQVKLSEAKKKEEHNASKNIHPRQYRQLMKARWRL